MSNQDFIIKVIAIVKANDMYMRYDARNEDQRIKARAISFEEIEKAVKEYEQEDM